MKIWAHTLVKNEERYLWYAVESVINYVDRLLLWDTGSTDNTVEIIKLLKEKHPEKIDTRFLGEVTPIGYTKLRQEMLDLTKSDWFLILDGDEVWWDEGIKRVMDIARSEKRGYESVVNGYYSVIGDIFHYQDESAGKYEIDAARGHITIRLINKNIPGLYTTKPHGQHGYFDENGVLVQERLSAKRYHLKEKTYLHFTHVLRSSTVVKNNMVPKRRAKLKSELGISFRRDFYYPEVLFRDKPSVVSSPWAIQSRGNFIKGFIITPLRKIKRRIFKSRVGY